ncbi:MAG TPA: hypothetical protein VE404_03905 [Verrucomicrobiae bacterium]|nr:hypothetical protein [Verrucomicrobiae bacterium]
MALALAGAASWANDAKPAYSLITADGHRIDVTEKPVPQGEKVILKLFPSGDSAVYPAKAIDWPATERFNAPPPSAAAPAPQASPAAGTPEVTAPGRGRSATRSDGVLSLKLVGGGHARATKSPENAAPGEAAPAPSGATPAKPADPKETASLLATLAKEMADLKQVQSGFVANKERLSADLAALEAKAANAPPAGLNNYESPTKKAIDDLRAQIQAVDDQLEPIERRMQEIRVRQSELGTPGD